MSNAARNIIRMPVRETVTFASDASIREKVCRYNMEELFKMARAIADGGRVMHGPLHCVLSNLEDNCRCPSGSTWCRCGNGYTPDGEMWM